MALCAWAWVLGGRNDLLRRLYHLAPFVYSWNKSQVIFMDLKHGVWIPKIYPESKHVILFEQ